MWESLCGPYVGDVIFFSVLIYGRLYPLGRLGLRGRCWNIAMATDRRRPPMSFPHLRIESQANLKDCLLGVLLKMGSIRIANPI